MSRWITFALVRHALVILTAAGGVCLASPGPEPNSPLTVQSLGRLGWAVADFDGDNLPDVAITTAEGRSEYVLELELSTKRGNGFPARSMLPSLPSSRFGLHLTPRDVDGEHDL